MHAYDFTFYSSSIAIQHVETARPYRTLTCVHWSTVPYDFGHLSVAVRRLIRLICISARPSRFSMSVLQYVVSNFLLFSSFAVPHIDSLARRCGTSVVVEYASSSVHRHELLPRPVLFSSARRFFGASRQLVHLRPMRQLFFPWSV